MDAVAIENGKPWVVGRDYWVGDRVPPVKPMKPRVFKEHGEWGEWVVLDERTVAFHRTWREASIHARALANREYYSNLGGPTP